MQAAQVGVSGRRNLSDLFQNAPEITIPLRENTLVCEFTLLLVGEGENDPYSRSEISKQLCGEGDNYKQA